jgi:adenylate kinase family enzyme
MEVKMKIHIIGGSGTGKSYLANSLSEKYNIPHYDLDNLQWDNTANTYGVKMPVDKRNKLLKEILEKENWIIDGVYYKWCLQCFEDADIIYILEVPRKIYRFRIIKRFIKRKLGIEKGKKESLSSLKALLKWADKFQTVDIEEIKSVLQKYNNKVVLIKGTNGSNNLLNI